MADAPAPITRFYREALTVNAVSRPTAVLESCLAPEFVSTNLKGAKDRAALAAQVEGFWKLIPDLDWAPQEIISAGDRHVVRSIASGSPRGDFMGMTLDGSRSFRIDTIDIHTVRGGRIVAAYHIEDWATAMAQLKTT